MYIKYFVRYVRYTQTVLTWRKLLHQISPFFWNLFPVIVGSNRIRQKSKVNPAIRKWKIPVQFLPIIPISNIVLTIFCISGCVLWYTAEIRRGNLWRQMEQIRVRTIFAGDNKIISKKICYRVILILIQQIVLLAPI